jgi:protein-tyrosine phosphatase
LEHRFGPAFSREETVFGASRPGYPDLSVPPVKVDAWMKFMRARDIQRVVCLLPEDQLAYYPDQSLLETYGSIFGSDNLHHESIEDCHLPSPEELERVVLFLQHSDGLAQKTVVHCSGGIGRTGLVIAAWLIHARGFEIEDAIREVRNHKPSRNPLESISTPRITENEIKGLLGLFLPTDAGDGARAGPDSPGEG